MRAVIVGGSGMIGRHLAVALLADGWAVDILTRDVSRATRRIPRGARAVTWSPDTAAGLKSVLEGADGVINLAGVSLGPRPWTPGRKRAILDSRLAATNALVAAMRSLPPERRPGVLVNASGSDVYTGRDAQPADESTEPSHDFLADVCLRWEAAAREAEPLGVRVAFVRTAFVLAPDAPVLRLLALPFRLFVGGRLGSGRQWFSWIHIHDLVGIYCLALTDPTISGPINAGAPEPCRQADLARAIGRTLHRPVWLLVPAWAIRLALRDQATLLLGSRRVVPTRAQAAGYEFRRRTIEGAIADVLG
ncbi:MAG: TIGR01777 family oxidoreductase [Chloroflexota bacterium]